MGNLLETGCRFGVCVLRPGSERTGRPGQQRKTPAEGRGWGEEAGLWLAEPVQVTGRPRRKKVSAGTVKPAEEVMKPGAVVGRVVEMRVLAVPA